MDGRMEGKKGEREGWKKGGREVGRKEGQMRERKRLVIVFISKSMDNIWALFFKTQWL